MTPQETTGFKGEATSLTTKYNQKRISAADV